MKAFHTLAALFSAEAAILELVCRDLIQALYDGHERNLADEDLRLAFVELQALSQLARALRADAADLALPASPPPH